MYCSDKLSLSEQHIGTSRERVEKIVVFSVHQLYIYIHHVNSTLPNKDQKSGISDWTTEQSGCTHTK